MLKIVPYHHDGYYFCFSTQMPTSKKRDRASRSPDDHHDNRCSDADADDRPDLDMPPKKRRKQVRFLHNEVADAQYILSTSLQVHCQPPEFSVPRQAARAPRRCSVCRKEGHDKRQCPENRHAAANRDASSKKKKKKSVTTASEPLAGTTEASQHHSQVRGRSPKIRHDF